VPISTIFRAFHYLESLGRPPALHEWTQDAIRGLENLLFDETQRINAETE
jgi:hypothetical protein